MSPKGSYRAHRIAKDVLMRKETLDINLEGNALPGDVLAPHGSPGCVAAKRTHGLIRVSSAAAHQGRNRYQSGAFTSSDLVQSTVKVTAKTGVEMEALTAVSIACLTIYDMVKAVERGIRIEGIRLLHKSGGKSGEWNAGG
jgi:cyclic pyranopterin phosphate synthase